jgi:hypothetical protein
VFDRLTWSLALLMLIRKLGRHIVIRRTTPRAPAAWPPADLPCREQMPPPGLLLTRREEASIHDTLKGNTVKRDGGAGGAARS